MINTTYLICTSSTPRLFPVQLVAAYTTRPAIGGGRYKIKIDPVLGGNGTKIAPTGHISDQPPSVMS